jgi:hypothetical protein
MRYLAVLALLAGCASVRGRADDAFAEGRYLDAAELYDQVGDADAIAHRDAARQEALKQLRAAYHTSASPDVAARQLQELLAYRDGWGAVFEVDPEVEQTGMYLTGLVELRTPLVAESVVAFWRALLSHADFRDARGRLATIVADHARAACAALAPTTPYATWLVDAYCTHFGIARGDALPLPELRGGLAVTGAIAGESDDQTAALHTALARAFRGTPWYGAGAPLEPAAVDGQLAQRTTTRDVTRTKDWVESVPYEDTETYDEPYEESYQDTENYTEVDSDGNICNRTRTVTRYRTAYRTATREVTRYRDEARTFVYQAVEYTRHSTAALHVRSALAEAHASSDFTETGDEHDVTFAQAGVVPEQPSLTSEDALAAAGERGLAAELAARLAYRWTQEFCTLSTYAAEDAARCLYGDGPTAPVAAHRVLEALFGPDEPYLATFAASAR